MTSVPAARSAASWALSEAMRTVSSWPIPEVMTPVPSLTTMRLGRVVAAMGEGREARGTATDV